MYYVNPVFICKGERFAMYTEYVQKTSQLNMFENSNQNQLLESYETKNVDERLGEQEK